MTMLSRVANKINWMARYLERAENTARIINVNTNLLLDLPKRVRLGWEPIVDITSQRVLFYSLYEEADEYSVVRFMVTDTRNPDEHARVCTRAPERAAGLSAGTMAAGPSRRVLRGQRHGTHAQPDAGNR